jgi:hypothetical protein
MPAPSRRLRLCLKDLYHQDVLEMIERESRAFELSEIVDPDDPDFAAAYELLWSAFGDHGEMEREDALRRFLREDPLEPNPDGTFLRYFLIVARDRKGHILGVRDGSVLVNPAYAADLCVVYLSHLYMRPEARGTVLSYELRIAPVDIAVEFLAELHARGRIKLPAPDSPGRYFGMRINLTAEMGYYSPTELVSWQRILFYGRGGFDAVNPRHFPYVQPDFRDPADIHATGNRPLPFMILVRRMGREREATMAIDEARATMRLLYDDFACHCDPVLLAASRQRVLDRLAERSTRKNFVELLPLPSSSKDLNRLRALFRFAVFQKYYVGASPVVAEYLDDPANAAMRDPAWLNAEIEKLARHLDTQQRYVYANRERDPRWTTTTGGDGESGG